MENFFFFTDKQSWLNITQEKPFGIINTDEFRVCNQFKFDSSTNNVAFAVTRSILLVQNAVDSFGNKIDGIINIALKPLEPVIWEYEYINYFIYRGIKKSSLINNNGKIAVAQSQDVSDLRNLLYKQQARINEELEINESPKQSHIGYDFASNLEETDPFYANDDMYLEDIIELDGEELDIQLPIVEAGMLIGSFKDGIDAGFEIIGERIGYETKMGDLRKENHIIDVSGYTGFERKHKKEEILHFFDPVAFYGSLTVKETPLNYEVLVKKSSGDQYIDVLIRENNYELLNKYLNKQKVYLDIRHETGYSYNYFNEFNLFPIENPFSLGQNIQFGFFNTSFNNILGYKDEWPLFIVDFSSELLSIVDDIEPEEHSLLSYEFLGVKLQFGNLIENLTTLYSTSDVSSLFYDNLLYTFLNVFGKGITNPTSESGNLDDLKIKAIEVVKNIAPEKSEIHLDIFLSDTSEKNRQRIIPGYINIRLSVDYKTKIINSGIIPRRLNFNLTTGKIDPPENSLIRYDSHPLDMMFPIFEMKPIFKPKLNRVSVRLYSQSNAFPIAGSYGGYYDELYVPRLGMAVDNSNYTFFTYIDNKNIIHSAKDSSDIKSHLNSSFTIGEADFLFSLTKQDLNITLNKKNINYTKTVGEIKSTVNVKPLYFTLNNAIDGLNNELDYEHFDCVTITKEQFETLEILKTQEGFSDKYRVFLGLSIYGKRSINNGGEYRRAKILLKGLREDDMGNVTEKHIDTGISTYAYHRIPRKLEY
ncbi:hypothetical protein [Tenacibaculum agarivorans]|uniref:hypothetical protein n=1 Tax=Tenacibaculum agarivorans TaxID=1908389 RepID=UPI00094B8286|nr:hypothetical protein [Tenacibaculum agarivorans]